MANIKTGTSNTQNYNNNKTNRHIYTHSRITQNHTITSTPNIINEITAFQTIFFLEISSNRRITSIKYIILILNEEITHTKPRKLRSTITKERYNRPFLSHGFHKHVKLHSKTNLHIFAEIRIFFKENEKVQ